MVRTSSSNILSLASCSPHHLSCRSTDPKLTRSFPFTLVLSSLRYLAFGEQIDASNWSKRKPIFCRSVSDVTPARITHSDPCHSCNLTNTDCRQMLQKHVTSSYWVREKSHNATGNRIRKNEHNFKNYMGKCLANERYVRGLEL